MFALHVPYQQGVRVANESYKCLQQAVKNNNVRWFENVLKVFVTNVFYVPTFLRSLVNTKGVNKVFDLFHQLVQHPEYEPFCACLKRITGNVMENANAEITPNDRTYNCCISLYVHILVKYNLQQFLTEWLSTHHHFVIADLEYFEKLVVIYEAVDLMVKPQIYPSTCRMQLIWNWTFYELLSKLLQQCTKESLHKAEQLLLHAKECHTIDVNQIFKNCTFYDYRQVEIYRLLHNIFGFNSLHAPNRQRLTEYMMMFLNLDTVQFLHSNDVGIPLPFENNKIPQFKKGMITLVDNQSDVFDYILFQLHEEAQTSMMNCIANNVISDLWLIDVFCRHYLRLASINSHPIHELVVSHHDILCNIFEDKEGNSLVTYNSIERILEKYPCIRDYVFKYQHLLSHVPTKEFIQRYMLCFQQLLQLFCVVLFDCVCKDVMNLIVEFI